VWFLVFTYIILELLNFPTRYIPRYAYGVVQRTRPSQRMSEIIATKRCIVLVWCGENGYYRESDDILGTKVNVQESPSKLTDERRTSP